MSSFERRGRLAVKDRGEGTKGGYATLNGLKMYYEVHGAASALVEEMTRPGP